MNTELLLSKLEGEWCKWENEANTEKATGQNVVKHAAYAGTASGLRIAIMIIEEEIAEARKP